MSIYGTVVIIHQHELLVNLKSEFFGCMILSIILYWIGIPWFPASMWRVYSKDGEDWLQSIAVLAFFASAVWECIIVNNILAKEYFEQMIDSQNYVMASLFSKIAFFVIFIIVLTVDAFGFSREKDVSNSRLQELKAKYAKKSKTEI